MRLLPDDVMTQIVQEVISEKVAKGIENFIFTGFPRTLGQLEYYDKMILNFSKESEVKNVFIEYRVSDETTLERSRKRRSDTESRGEVSRPWDSDEGVAKRISTYYREIEPMIEKLRNEERLFTIEAEKTIPEVEAETSIRLSKERF
jgi:adenylate kinase family enzyme